MIAERLLAKAEALAPEIHREKIEPSALPGDLEAGSVLLSFPRHLVGKLHLKLSYQGELDAPIWLQVRFFERRQEQKEDPSAYHGWLASSWIQSEELRLDSLEEELPLPRRYAFRYAEILVKGKSMQTKLSIAYAYAEAETSCGKEVAPVGEKGSLEREIDETSLLTLRECMQSVLEDGPKRDHRLWAGDLRLQGLANLYTYKDFPLVKRCLYLLASDLCEDGSVPQSFFTEPYPHAEKHAMFDYRLVYVKALQEYVEATGDQAAFLDLLPIAKKQVDISLSSLDENGVLPDSSVLGWSFIDWSLSLNKQLASMGVLLFALDALIPMLKDAGIDASSYEKAQASLKEACLRFYDEKEGLFVSGADCQLSYASQIWMVLGGVKEGKEAQELLSRMEKAPNLLTPATPYLMHYYAEALWKCGAKEKAKQTILSYWGGMKNEEGDTFPEFYDPKDPLGSPYGGTVVLSYCHAWSCTPSYFFRLEEGE